MNRAATTTAWLAGAVLLAWLLLGQDWQTFAPSLAGGLWGVGWLSAFHAVPLLLDTLAWRALLPADTRPGIGSLSLMRWHGESVNSLLPAAQVGGDLLRVRLAARAGVPGPLAAASVVVDLTLSVLTLLIFVAGGVAFIALQGERAERAALTLGFLLSVAALGGFWALQRSGWLLRMARRFGPDRSDSLWKDVARNADAFAASLDRVYRDRRALWRSGLLALAAWCAGAGEVWLGLMFLDHPVSFPEALLIESLVQAIRNIAFFVPGALGVQDGGLMLIGALVGVPGEMALALALLKRGRELTLGVPGLAHGYWRLARRSAL